MLGFRLAFILGAAAAVCHASGVPCPDDRLQWFRSAKFGMFIHWGPYSMLAGEWNGKRVAVGRNAEWIMKFFQIPVSDYRQLAHNFNPVSFDAGLWARLAKTTGMKYVVITAKHHDGFAMYHSMVSRYNIVDWTSFRRDPLKEFSEACRKQDVRPCVYYSHREDWDHPDAYGNDWDYTPSSQNFERYLEEKSKPQLREILTGYGPLGLIWFDRGLCTPQQAREFVDLVRQLQPRCLINGRVGNYDQELMGDYQNMSDNGMPTGGLDEYWETPQTLNRTWGYSKYDNSWKSPQEIIRRLVEIVSKGGNYLLNIGPTGEGTIPEPTLAILKAVGTWMDKNGESIYDTAASPFPDFPWGRCTLKGEMLYLHVLNWPADRILLLPGLRNNVRTARLLTEPSRRLPVRKEGNTVRIEVPARPPDARDTVISLSVYGKPSVEPPIVVQQKSSPVRLDYLTAVTSGSAVKRFNRLGRFHISKWTKPQDSAAWRLQLSVPGCYTVRITYSTPPKSEGSRYRIVAGSSSITGTVEHTGEWYKYQTSVAGCMEFPKAGEYHLTIGPAAPYERDFMYLKSLDLSPPVAMSRGVCHQ